MSKKVIKLEYPIVVDGIETSELSMRRCLVSDIKAMDRVKGEMEKSINLAAALCGISPQAIESMDASDFMKLAEELSGFLPSAGVI